MLEKKILVPRSWVNPSFQGITTSKCYTFDKTSLVLFICFFFKKRKIHYTDFFLLRNLGPRTVLGRAPVGEWTVGGGIHMWEMEGFLDTGHFLGLAQEWHSRQLQNKDIHCFFNPIYPHIKQKGSGYIFTSSNPYMLFIVSRRFFQLPLSQSPFRILEKTAHSSSILLRSITLRFTYFCGFKQRHD